MSITPTFSVGSGIGKSRKSTPTTSSSLSQRGTSSSQVQERNKQLMHMKEQFLSLKQQFKEEQMQDNEKIMTLERQLRQEIKKTQELERQLNEVKSRNSGARISGSVRVVENIWNIMTEYREQIRNGALERNRDKQNEQKYSKKVGFDEDNDSDAEYSVIRRRK